MTMVVGAMVLGTGMAAGPVLAQGSTTAPAQSTTGTGVTRATPGTPSAATNVPEVTRSRDAMAANAVLMHRPRLSQLIGTNVYNENNEAIGEVDDILLSGGMGSGTMRGGTAGTTAPGTTGTSAAVPPGTGTAGTGAAGSTTAMGTGTGTGTMAPAMGEPMAVIQVGGFLGIGARLVTVPLSEMQWNAERERVILPNATKETLQSRPAFDYDTLRRG
jgi:hypothetical protein